ncbi:phage tail spike protein [Peribacillus muralis]|uniref:phage tail spike protein n=1 Tax=Peribacillus muralis TaxID=264697 RepID=UPI00366DF3CB
MIFVLDNNEKMVGVLNNLAPLSCPYFDDFHTENIQTGVNNYEFSVPAGHETSESLVADGYIILADLDNKLQMFQIKEVEEEAGESEYNKRVYSEHVAIPELLATPFRPLSMKSLSLKQAMDVALQGSGWTLGEYDWSGIVDIEFDEYITALEAIYTIIESFGAELRFEIQFKNGVVTKRLVHVASQLGRVTNKRFVYGKDLVGVKRTYNSEGVVSALIGVGKGDTDGARLTLAGYDPDSDTQKDALPKGYEKPVSADWVGNEAALQAYGKDGKHRIGIFIDDTAINVESLLVNTLKELKVRMKPKATYEMQLATLERATGFDVVAEEVRIGDTIIADDETLKPRFLLEARIIELKRSYTAPELDECTLGDYRPIKISNYASINKIQSLISANEEKWNAVTYQTQITSSMGTSFKNGEGTTVLTAHVFTNNSVLDLAGTEFLYTWDKTDANGNITKSFKEGKSITVTAAELAAKCKFSLTVNIP